MKRSIILILTLCLLATLSACGTPAINTTADEPAAPPASEPAPAENDEANTSADTPAPVLEPEDEEQPTDEITEPDDETDTNTSTDTADTSPEGESEQPSAAPEETEQPTQAESSHPSDPPAQPEQPQPSEPEPEQTPPPQEQAPVQAPQEPEKKIPIAYFTWADNTYVDDPSSVDPTIDAPSSASILPPGDTARIAGWIQQEVGGDLHSIITVDAYSSDYDECLDRAIEEHDNGIRPALSSSVSNMADYDIVFLGYPNWWYSCPMAILTFIEENDLSGKTIIPYCTHGTGGLASSLRGIKAALPSDCTVLQEYDVSRSGVRSAQPAVLEWLDGLDLDI